MSFTRIKDKEPVNDDEEPIDQPTPLRSMNLVNFRNRQFSFRTDTTVGFEQEQASVAPTYGQVGALAALTFISGPVGFALGGATITKMNMSNSNNQRVVLPPKIEPLAKPIFWAVVIIPFIVLLYGALFLIQVLWQLVSAAVEAFGAYLIGYIVYLTMGLTIQVRRFSFNFWIVKSDLIFEVKLGELLIVNPRGDYQTPYFLAVEAIELRVPFVSLIRNLVRQQGLLDIPYVAVREVTIFFEKAKLEDTGNLKLNLFGIIGFEPSQFHIDRTQRVADKFLVKLRYLHIHRVLMFTTDLVAHYLGSSSGLGEKCIEHPIKLESDVIMGADNFVPSNGQVGQTWKQAAGSILQAIRKDLDLQPIIQEILASQSEIIASSEKEAMDYMNSIMNAIETDESV